MTPSAFDIVSLCLSLLGEAGRWILRGGKNAFLAINPEEAPVPLTTIAAFWVYYPGGAQPWIKSRNINSQQSRQPHPAEHNRLAEPSVVPTVRPAPRRGALPLHYCQPVTAIAFARTQETKSGICRFFLFFFLIATDLDRR